MVFNREIERKYVVGGVQDYDPCLLTLQEVFPDADVLEGRSTDTFWTQPGTDFIRLRRNTSELSVKVSDKGIVEDRIEENLVVDYDTARRFATATFGQPVGVLEKTYCVFTLPDYVVSLYTVTGHDDLFLEIESDNITTVREVSEVLREFFDMHQEHRSLFQIIFGEE